MAPGTSLFKLPGPPLTLSLLALSLSSLNAVSIDGAESPWRKGLKNSQHGRWLMAKCKIIHPIIVTTAIEFLNVYILTIPLRACHTFNLMSFRSCLRISDNLLWYHAKFPTQRNRACTPNKRLYEQSMSKIEKFSLHMLIVPVSQKFH